jgi:hypothetical protein
MRIRSFSPHRRAEHKIVVFTNLLLHFVPPIWWGAKGATVIAPLLWSFVGAGCTAFVKSRNRNFDRLSEYFFMTGWRPAIIADVTIRGLLFSVPLNLICYFAGAVVARSGGMMRALESLLIAYCMAGLYHVLCNLRQPTTRGFTYIESGLGWLPMSVIRFREPEGQIFSHTIFCCSFFTISAFVLFLI